MHPRVRRSALSLLDVAVSLALLGALLLGVFFLLLRSREAVGVSGHSRAARLAAEGVLEQMRAQANGARVGAGSFASLAADWSTTRPDAEVMRVPARPGQAALPGDRFRVPGLPRRTLPGQGEVPQGRVIVTLDEAAIGLDLDGDGQLTTLAPTAKYRVLPVRIEVGWGPEAEPKLVLETLISRRSQFQRRSEQ